MQNNPFQVLGLEPSASADEVKAHWRKLASQHHPDRGGDAELFDTLRQAYNQALRDAQTPTKCSECGGTGRIGHSRGFSSIQYYCERCNGTGKT